MGRREMRKELESAFNVRRFLLPKNNHWLKRTVLVFAFVLFDYFSTLVFCHAPHEEANLFARVFMENFGVSFGLTLFVVMMNLPIYITLSLDSHVVKLPLKATIVAEFIVDLAFAWFIAGSHFNGGASWFWYESGFVRQIFGAVLYLGLAFPLLKPHKQQDC
jgi:hypothetical protein